MASSRLTTAPAVRRAIARLRRSLVVALCVALGAGAAGTLAGSFLATAAGAADGTGTITVAPTSVITGSSGNFLTFTYTADAAGLNNGEIDLTVPAGWTTPTSTSGNPGGTTAPGCGLGFVTVSGNTIQASGVTLAGGATCQIRYGLSGFNAGDTAPGTSGTSTFTTSEKSSAGGTLTNLAVQPTVLVNSDGTGTMTVSPGHVVAGSSWRSGPRRSGT